MDGKTATTTTAADVSAAHEPAHSAAQSSSSQDVPQARSNKVGASSELPEPNHDLGSIDVDQNLEAIRSFAEPTTRIFAGPYLNVDDVVDAYFDALKMIIQTPTSDEDAHLRTEAYARINAAIRRYPDAIYEHLKDILFKWAQEGYKEKEEPSVVFKKPNGEEYYEPSMKPDAHANVRSVPQEQIVLPADFSWYADTFERRASPLLERVLLNPRSYNAEEGSALASINQEIAEHVQQEQERLRTSGAPTVNVDLKVPVQNLLMFIMMCTKEMVSAGKETIGGLDDKWTREYNLLKTRMERAQQPASWHNSLSKFIEQKAKLWNKGTDTQSSEELWDASLENAIFGKTAPLDPELLQKLQQAQGDSQGSRPERMDTDSDSGSGAPPASQGPPPSARTSKFADAVKVDIDPGYVVDEGQRRKIEGYAEAGRGHSLLIRMSEEAEKPAKCHLTAAGPFGRGTLTAYQSSANARHIQGWTDWEALKKTRKITDLNCTFIAVQRGTCSRAIIGGRFDDDKESVERHYYRTQLNRAFGSKCVDGWIKEIWSDAYVKRETESPSDQNGGTYATDNPFGLAREKSEAGPSTGKAKQNGSKRQEKPTEADIMDLVDAKMREALAEQMKQFSAMVQGIQITR